MNKTIDVSLECMKNECPDILVYEVCETEVVHIKV